MEIKKIIHEIIAKFQKKSEIEQFECWDALAVIRECLKYADAKEAEMLNSGKEIVLKKLAEVERRDQAIKPTDIDTDATWCRKKLMTATVSDVVRQANAPLYSIKERRLFPFKGNVSARELFLAQMLAEQGNDSVLKSDYMQRKISKKQD